MQSPIHDGQSREECECLSKSSEAAKYTKSKGQNHETNLSGELIGPNTYKYS
jgi:hypothetical protein